MAVFTQTQIADICEILELNSDEVGSRLSYYATRITDEDKTKVLGLIEDWQTLDAADTGTRVKANLSNFGSEYSPETRMTKLAARIAKFLYLDDLSGSGSSLEMELVRG